jgi:phage tail sheath protein FI
VQKPEPDTWRAVSTQVGRYLSDATRAGLLAGGESSRAWYVKCDQDTNARPGSLSFVVGLALTRPGEFVAFRFDHDAASCRVTELTWQPDTLRGT